MIGIRKYTDKDMPDQLPPDWKERMVQFTGMSYIVVAGENLKAGQKIYLAYDGKVYHTPHYSRAETLIRKMRPKYHQAHLEGYAGADHPKGDSFMPVAYWMIRQ